MKLKKDTKEKIIRWLEKNRPEYFKEDSSCGELIIGAVEYSSSRSGFSEVILDMEGISSPWHAPYSFLGFVPLRKGDIITFCVEKKRYVDVFNENGIVCSFEEDIGKALYDAKRG